MRNLALLGALSAVGLVCAAPTAFAHAQLLKSTPGVGSTVASASEIRLKFSEGVESRFSKISLTAAGAAAVPLGAANTGPGDATVLVAPIAKPLAPGVYAVHWSAVSNDTHRTQGDFQFTVAP